MLQKNPPSAPQKSLSGLQKQAFILTLMDLQIGCSFSDLGSANWLDTARLQVPFRFPTGALTKGTVVTGMQKGKPDYASTLQVSAHIPSSKIPLAKSK